MIRDIAPRRRVAAAVAGMILTVIAAPLLVLNALRRRKGPISRILVLEPWGIGDLVLATGALRSCRAAFPAARITVLAKAYAEAIVISPEMADEVIAYDFPWTAFAGKYRLDRYDFRALARLILRMRRSRYDLVLNARADIRNNVIGALVGGRRFVSVSCGAGDFLATEVVQLERDAHRVEDWARVSARATGQPAADVEPRLTIDAAERVRMRAELGVGVEDTPVIGIHPGAAALVRRWELTRFADVARQLDADLGARIVVFADPDGYGTAIARQGGGMVVQRPLAEMLVALSICDLVICNDSGPMHLANALGVPVVALFGPGQLEWFGPRGGPSRIVRIDEMPCRPCFDHCRFAEPVCLTPIDADAVVAAAKCLLATVTVTRARDVALPRALKRTLAPWS